MAPDQRTRRVRTSWTDIVQCPSHGEYWPTLWRFVAANIASNIEIRHLFADNSTSLAVSMSCSGVPRGSSTRKTIRRRLANQ